MCLSFPLAASHPFSDVGRRDRKDLMRRADRAGYDKLRATWKVWRMGGTKGEMRCMRPRLQKSRQMSSLRDSATFTTTDARLDELKP